MKRETKSKSVKQARKALEAAIRDLPATELNAVRGAGGPPAPRGPEVIP